MQKVHIVLQELQVVVLMLCSLTFHLCDGVVALHVDNKYC